MKFIPIILIVSILVLEGFNMGMLNRWLNAYLIHTVQAAEVADSNKATPKEVFTGLRGLALSAKSTDFPNVEKIGKSGVYGVLMELGYPEGVVTLSAFITGDASVYFSSGGGIVGGMDYEIVRKTAIAFNQQAAKFVSRGKKVISFPTPMLGQAVFYILTQEGIYSIEALENDLGNNRSPYSPLFYAGQDVITEFRLIEEEKQKK